MNVEFFDKYFVYFLGFFWGDGGIKCKDKATIPKISIVSDDAVFIEKIIPPWIVYTKKIYCQENRRERTDFKFKNLELKQFLIEFGAMNKSWDNQSKILSKIPTNLHYYFWRGFIDADGCFYKNKKQRGGSFSICSSIKQDWSSVESLLESIDIYNYKIYRKITKNGCSSTIEIKYSQDINKLGNYIYSNYDEIGLLRKYKKFIEIKSSMENLTSSYKGISFHKKIKKWRAYYKNKFLGWWDSEEEARQARVKFLSQTFVS
jgi:hypothetical protein